jgi:endonuclease YncB( thermonuclease family)
MRNLFLLAVAASVMQLATRGELTWPGALWQQVGDYLQRPQAGWQQAREALERQGERRESVPATFDLEGRVVRIADGDTLSLLDTNGQQHKIRLYAIDTPELHQAHGQAAREALSRLVYRKTVGVVVVDVDDYQRKVGTVYRDGTNVNLTLVARGHAWWYRYHAPHERPLEAAEAQARDQGLGLWAADTPVPPWDWRRNQRR